MDPAHPSPEVVRQHAVGNAQIVIQAKVVAEDDGHDIVLDQPLGKLGRFELGWSREPLLERHQPHHQDKSPDIGCDAACIGEGWVPACRVADIKVCSGDKDRQTTAGWALADHRLTIS